MIMHFYYAGWSGYAAAAVGIAGLSIAIFATIQRRPPLAELVSGSLVVVFLLGAIGIVEALGSAAGSMTLAEGNTRVETLNIAFAGLLSSVQIAATLILLLSLVSFLTRLRLGGTPQQSSMARLASPIVFASVAVALAAGAAGAGDVLEVAKSSSEFRDFETGLGLQTAFGRVRIGLLVSLAISGIASFALTIARRVR